MPKIMSYKKGSIIFFEGDKDERIFILQSGKVELQTTDIVSGLPVTEQVNSGDFFGVKNALVKEPRTDTARALLDTQAIVLTTSEFEKLFAGNKDAIQKMLSGFTKSVLALNKSTETLLNKSTETPVREVGMLQIAQTFYNSERYRSALSQCEKIINDIPDPSNKDEVTELLSQTRLKVVAMDEKELHHHSFSEEIFVDDNEQKALKQFSAPIFDRFTKNFATGDVIISEYTKTKSFYFVKSGQVSIEKNINGVMKRYGLLRPGDIFGEMEILEDCDRLTTATAKGSVSCVKLGKENFSNIVIGSSSVAMIMLRIMCKRYFETLRNLKILCIKDKAARLADIFLMLTEQAHLQGTDEYDMKRKLFVSTDEVAQIAGMTFEETKEEMNKMVSRNKLTVFNDYIVISNIMDMKRTVDSYYANLEPEKPDQQKQQQQPKQ